MGAANFYSTDGSKGVVIVDTLSELPQEGNASLLYIVRNLGQYPQTKIWVGTEYRELKTEVGWPTLIGKPEHLVTEVTNVNNILTVTYQNGDTLEVTLGSGSGSLGGMFISSKQW